MRFERVGNNSGDFIHLTVLQLEALSQALIGHPLVTHVAQAGVLIAGTYPIFAVHVFERLMREQHHACMVFGDSEVWSWKLPLLGHGNHLVDATAFFFAYPNATREIGKAFIAGFIFVNGEFSPKDTCDII